MVHVIATPVQSAEPKCRQERESPRRCVAPDESLPVVPEKPASRPIPFPSTLDSRWEPVQKKPASRAIPVPPKSTRKIPAPPKAVTVTYNG